MMRRPSLLLLGFTFATGVASLLGAPLAELSFATASLAPAAGDLMPGANATPPAAPVAPAAAPVPAPAAAADPATPLKLPLTRHELLAGIGRDLKRHFNFEGDLELDLLRPWTPPSRLAASWTVSVTEFPTIATSSMLIHCRITADGHEVDEPTVIVSVALWRRAWATRMPLTYGSTFDPSLLETRRVDLLRQRDALPAAVGNGSYIFTRSVPAGTLLTWRDIARRPLVKRGTMVDVSAVDGALSVTMKGLAMQNGARGDTITIRNPDSQKVFSALVTDENHVQVQF